MKWVLHAAIRERMFHTDEIASAKNPRKDSALGKNKEVMLVKHEDFFIFFSCSFSGYSDPIGLKSASLFQGILLSNLRNTSIHMPWDVLCYKQLNTTSNNQFPICSLVIQGWQLGLYVHPSSESLFWKPSVPKILLVLISTPTKRLSPAWTPSWGAGELSAADRLS